MYKNSAYATPVSRNAQRKTQKNGRLRRIYTAKSYKSQKCSEKG